MAYVGGIVCIGKLEEFLIVTGNNTGLIPYCDKT